MPRIAAVLALAAAARLRGQLQPPVAVECAALPTLENAEPAAPADRSTTRFNSASKKREVVMRAAGTTVPYRCASGHSANGAKDGPAVVEVVCTQHGYYELKGSCVEFSPCGALPEVPHSSVVGVGTARIANPRGSDSKRFDVEFRCDVGYSTDGEEPGPAGGDETNRQFRLHCDAFSGKFDAVGGAGKRCEPHAFIPATEAAELYNKVFQALFTVSCTNDLKRQHALGGDMPAALSVVCEKLEGGTAEGPCQEFVDGISSEWAVDKAEFDASSYCDGLWRLFEHTPAATR